jgi:ribonuclease P protein component
MIKNQNRLRKNKHFKYIYKNGETKSAQCLAVCFVKSKIQPFKVGFSVSKKIGKSVVRNKVKRRLRESFCSLCSNINKKHNYIFIAKQGIENLTFFDIKQTMLQLLSKNGLYEKNN